MTRNPRIVIAAPGSGSGKTMFTCALLRALQKKGLSVRSFKCGPDYIDPMFHREVLGVPARNLDLYFTEEEKTRQLFLLQNDVDITIVEGVMGLYDGLGGISEEASTYHLAKTLQAPIVLVVDVHGMGRSVIPYIKGFLDYDSQKLIQGIVLNKTTKSWASMIAPVIEKELGIAVLGFFPKQEGLVIESRHLGLTMPKEQKQLLLRVDAAASVLEESVPLGKIVEIAKRAPALQSAAVLHPAKKQNVRIAVARDEAFCFYYEDNLRLLEEMGAELVYFSPIHDATLPEHVQGLLLGGGYPELYAKNLSENEGMRTAIFNAIAQGMPSVAECGGFMYLHETITDEAGQRYPMVGVIAGSCEKKEGLVRFGYASFTEKQAFFLPAGAQIRGHEFHYYDSTVNGTDVVARKPTGKRSWEACHIGENHWWGFPHLYYESCPEFASHFVKECNLFADTCKPGTSG
ncbi:cobyrinic acid a,c-diamide synthase [Lachnospiraceae bacterium XBB1006]|nr:cobyrinic acid a,c-diamide synthase [Lachnospiraceae bacterium XBB1006]